MTSGRRCSSIFLLSSLLLLSTSGGALADPPSFVVINLDDTRADGVDAMPIVAARLAANGVSFENSFTPNAICCASRASLLTGLYSRKHGTLQISGALGGADTFRESGADQQTIAVWLQAGGYRTGLFGKYLNAYFDATEAGQGPGGSFYVPPGWDRWWAMVSAEHYGGVHGEDYEVVEEDGSRTVFDDHSDDSQYVTDLSAQEVQAFIASAVAEGKPFFAYWTPYASHVEVPGWVPRPADRDFGAFAGMPSWRPPSWSEPDVSDKPRWVQALSSDSLLEALTDVGREMAYESLLSVDDQIDQLLDLLISLGVHDDTVVIFTSDNGVSWGEHRRYAQNKECPYEECQRVPMIVSYPRFTTGIDATSAGTVLNIDIAPTLAQLAGVSTPRLDGRSLAAWLHGPPPGAWRSDYLIEHWRNFRGDSLFYDGQVADGDRIRLFYGETGLDPRPSLVYEFDSDQSVSPGSLPVAIGATADDSFENLGLAASLTFADLLYQQGPGLLTVFYTSSDLRGVYWWEEVDQGDAFEPLYFLPDHFGVRDVAGGYTWVEYETGERELYDLNIDPNQLENRADDSAYQAIREQLEQRLDTLLSPPRVPALSSAGRNVLMASLALSSLVLLGLAARSRSKPASHASFRRH